MKKCAVPGCDRKVLPRQANIYGICHRCIEVVKIIEYISAMAGQISETEVRAKNAGIQLPR